MNTEGVLKAIGKYGLPTVVALVLGYVLIAEVRADQALMKDQHAALVVEQQHLARGILKLADNSGEMHTLQEKVLMVMRAMCIQGATTAGDRRDCLRDQ